MPISEIIVGNENTYEGELWFCPLCTNKAPYGKFCAGKYCFSVENKLTHKLNIHGDRVLKELNNDNN